MLCALRGSSIKPVSAPDPSIALGRAEAASARAMEDLDVVALQHGYATQGGDDGGGSEDKPSTWTTPINASRVLGVCE